MGKRNWGRRNEFEGRGYSYRYERRRSKVDWAGINIGDAFKSHLDYYIRLPAQRLFYRSVRKDQTVAAKIACFQSESVPELKVKPQISPFYSSYPGTLAGMASIGLTAFLEYEQQAGETVLLSSLSEYLEDPVAYDGVDIDEEVYEDVAKLVARTVQTRLTIEDLSRHSLPSVEMYRIFSATLQTLRFATLQEILHAVILYGDIMPDWDAIELHPMTKSLIHAISQESRPFQAKLAETKSGDLIDLGIEWVQAICLALCDFLPREDKDDFDSELPSDGKEGVHRFEKNKPEFPDHIPPLNEPNSPSLLTEEDIIQQLAQEFLGSRSDSLKAGDEGDFFYKEHLDQWKSFADTINRSCGQESDWQDMRYDLIEAAIRRDSFEEGPIQGNPADGNEVSVDLGRGKTETGEIFDRPVELSEDFLAYEKLLNEAKPVTEEMRRALYPNIQPVPLVERFRTSGSIDPQRLVVAEISQAVFKRYRMQEQVDDRGRPVLVIACDGSSSLNSQQIYMLKILATAWLNSTLKTEIQVLAGLYHSGYARPNVSGPLVQWIYHPKKTPAISRKEAARAIVSLPDHGTGVQSDALSIAFILEEARLLARGRMIYLILITDCAWNMSFKTEMSGMEEVYSLLQSLNEDFDGKLHTTLVGLGAQHLTGFEDVVDRIIRISATDLANPVTVAKELGLYVASCLKERIKKI